MIGIRLSLGVADVTSEYIMDRADKGLILVLGPLSGRVS